MSMTGNIVSPMGIKVEEVENPVLVVRGRAVTSIAAGFSTSTSGAGVIKEGSIVIVMYYKPSGTTGDVTVKQGTKTLSPNSSGYNSSFYYKLFVLTGNSKITIENTTSKECKYTVIYAST